MEHIFTEGPQPLLRILNLPLLPIIAEICNGQIHNTSWKCNFFGNKKRQLWLVKFWLRPISCFVTATSASGQTSPYKPCLAFNYTQEQTLLYSPCVVDLKPYTAARSTAPRASEPGGKPFRPNTPLSSSSCQNSNICPICQSTQHRMWCFS